MGDFSGFSCFLILIVGVIATVALVRLTSLITRVKILEQQLLILQEQLNSLRLSALSRRPDPTPHEPVPLEDLRDERVPPEFKPKPAHHAPVPPPLPPQARTPPPPVPQMHESQTPKPVIHPPETIPPKPAVHPPEPAPLAEKIAAFTRVATPQPPTAPPPHPESVKAYEPPPAPPHLRDPVIPTAPPAPHIPAPPPKPPKPQRTLEQKVVMLIIGISGIALALAAIYFVQVASQKGWLTPPMKLSAAALFGLALLAAGQLKKFIAAPLRQPLTGAGIVVLFAVITAGFRLQPQVLTSPTLAFGLMVLVTAAAVALSLQQGIYVAALGLVGGFLTPVLIDSHSNKIPALFAYLFILQLGLMLVTRARQWFILALFTQLGCIAWILLVLGLEATHGFDPDHIHAMGLFLLAMAGTTLVTALSDAGERAWGQTSQPARILSWISVTASLLLSGILVGVSKFDNLEWAFLAVLAAATLLLARLRRTYAPMPWIAAGMTLLLLASGVFNARGWFESFNITLNNLPEETPQALANITRYRILFALFGSLFSLGAYACLWGSRYARRWVWLSVSAALAFMLTAYALLDLPPHVPAWALVPLAMAAIYAALSLPLFQRRAANADLADCLSDLFIGLCGLIAIAAAMALDHAWLTVGLAALVPAYLLLARSVKVPTPVICSMLLSLIVLIRLMLNPDMLAPSDLPMLQQPIFYAYGLTLLFLGAAAALLHWPAPIDLPRLQPTSNLAEHEQTLQPVYPAPHWASLIHVEIAALFLLWVTLLVRLYFHPHDVTAHSTTTTELTTFGVAWLLMGWLLSRLPAPPASRIIEGIGRFAMAAAGLYILIILGVYSNPLITGEHVGTTPIANSLLSLYGIPLLISFFITLDLKHRGRTLDASFGAALWSVLLVILTITQIRQGFHGTDLTSGTTFLTEIATYPLALILIAWGLLRLPQRIALETNTYIGKGLLLAAIYGGLFATGVIFNPVLTMDSVGTWHIFNLLLYVYGAPALLLFALTLDPALRVWKTGVELAGVAWTLFLALLLAMQIRQGFHGEFLRENATLLSEVATYSIAFLLLGWGLIRLPRPLAVAAHNPLGRGILGLANIATVLSLGMHFNPIYTGDPVGDLPIFNTLLFAYGLPTLLLFAISYDPLIRSLPNPTGDSRPSPESTLLSIGWLLMLLLLVMLQIRQGFHHSLLREGPTTLAELATYILAALAIGWGVLRMPERLFVEALGYMAWALLALSTAAAVLGLGLFDNPWVTAEDVGAVPIINVLFYAYGAPLALLAAITFDIARRGRKIEGLIGFIASILLLFILTTLQVRQAFHPHNLTAGDYSQSETYTYSAAWMLLSLALLTTGIAFKSQVLRWASLVLMLLTIGKVFLDVFSLGGLIRVASLLGLGLALLGIGWMYFKWVFRKPAPEPAPDQTPG